MDQRRQYLRRSLLLLLALAFFLAPCGQSAAAETAEGQPDRLSKILGTRTEFSYQREARSDPFLPFIREKVVDQEVASEDEVIEELTGLRKFEPGQLNLVAILFNGERAKAMVQDPVGKGYIIQPGTRIGRFGVIEDIVPNAVIIRQTTQTWDRRQLHKRVQMVLRKEGEK